MSSNKKSLKCRDDWFHPNFLLLAARRFSIKICGDGSTSLLRTNRFEWTLLAIRSSPSCPLWLPWRIFLLANCAKCTKFQMFFSGLKSIYVLIEIRCQSHQAECLFLILSSKKLFVLSSLLVHAAISMMLSLGVTL